MRIMVPQSADAPRSGIPARPTTHCQVAFGRSNRQPGFFKIQDTGARAQEMRDHTVPFVIEGPSYREGDPPASEIGQFRQQLLDSDAVSLFDYWTGKGSGGGVPDKKAIDPSDLPGLLPKIYMEEWDSDQQQSRIRLAGDLHRRIYGGNVQGLMVDDHATGATRELWKQCDRCNFIELRPTYCGYDLKHANKAFMTISDLTLPVRDRNGAVFTIGVISYL